MAGVTLVVAERKIKTAHPFLDGRPGGLHFQRPEIIRMALSETETISDE